MDNLKGSKMYSDENIFTYQAAPEWFQSDYV